MSHIFDNIDKNLLARFKDYHLNNPHVYEEFRSNAMSMLKTGRAKYSAKCIVEKIRWDHDIRTSGDVFSINNDFIALYARLLVHHNPLFKPFFEMRSMKESDRRCSDEDRYRKKGVKK